MPGPTDKLVDDSVEAAKKYLLPAGMFSLCVAYFNARIHSPENLGPFDSAGGNAFLTTLAVFAMLYVTKKLHDAYKESKEEWANRGDEQKERKTKLAEDRNDKTAERQHIRETRDQELQDKKAERTQKSETHQVKLAQERAKIQLELERTNAEIEATRARTERVKKGLDTPEEGRGSTPFTRSARNTVPATPQRGLFEYYDTEDMANADHRVQTALNRRNQDSNLITNNALGSAIQHANNVRSELGNQPWRLNKGTVIPPNDLASSSQYQPQYQSDYGFGNLFNSTATSSSWGGGQPPTMMAFPVQQHQQQYQPYSSSYTTMPQQQSQQVPSGFFTQQRQPPLTSLNNTTTPTNQTTTTSMTPGLTNNGANENE